MDRLAFYQPTHLESWIVERYQKLGILTPDDLNEKQICKIYQIHYKRALEAHSLSIGQFKLITVKETSTTKEQREQFYHELCHLLRHTGRQIMMPKAFRELQERDAKHFTRYAAIPFYMLKKFDLNDPDIIKIMSDRFKVTEELCHERLQKIFDRITYVY